MKTLPYLNSSLRSLAADQRGFSLVFTALAATVLMGVVGLAVDVGEWKMNQRNMQAAADQAAYSADIAAQAGQNATTQADAVAAQLGFVNGQGGVTIAVHNPPSQGSNTANSSAYEVVITQPQTMWFANFFLASAPTASARAVSAAATGGACVLALDTNNENHSIFVQNGTVSIHGCIVADNTVNGNAPNTTDTIDIKGTGVLNVDNVYLAVASICDSGNCVGTLNVSGTTKYNQPALTDPYASRTVPTPGSCSFTNLVVASTQTLSPGTYCSTTNNAALTVTASLTGTATANANKNTAVITMSSTSGVAVGMYVTDTKTANALASSTKVTAVTATTITVSPVIANNLKSNDTLTFSAAPFLAATANVNKPATVLTFASTTGVSAGMQVTDLTTTNAIASGTTVSSVTPTTVTLSAALANNLKNNDVVQFSTLPTVTLSSGVYILDGQGGSQCSGGSKNTQCLSGDLEVLDGATVTGSGVSIVLTTSTSGASVPNNIGQIFVDDNSNLTLSAPASGATSGLAIWQDSRAVKPGSPGGGYAETDSGVNTIGTGSSTNITGAIYLPSEALLFSGGSSTACTQLVAWSVQF